MDAGLSGQPEAHRDAGLALYVHIPFCRTRCPYCDFNTCAGIDTLVPRYLEALKAEIRAWGSILGRPRVRTVFIGGGTPSHIPAAEVASVCEVLRGAFAVQRDAECTLEANPGDCGRGKLSAYLDAGVNRLSVGVQSFDDELLRTLGRRHDAAGPAKAVERARGAGFRNVSLDLMYGVPGQTTEGWQTSLDLALAHAPEHLSLYALTLEPGTPMHEDVNRGRTMEPDPDLAAAMYEFAEHALDGAGYRHYEISNWAQPGRECLHNLAYWRTEPFLGVGGGAHSFLAGYRFANVSSPEAYVERLLPARVPGDVADPVAAMRGAGAVDAAEPVTPRLLLADTMMMGLRLDTGVSRAAFAACFGVGLTATFGPVIDELSGAGVLEADERGIRLTSRGRLLGNEVFGRFVDASRNATLPTRNSHGNRPENGLRNGRAGANMELRD